MENLLLYTYVPLPSFPYSTWHSIYKFLSLLLLLFPSLQLYYSYNGFGDPLHYKSAEQQYLLRHMRHPIFTAPFILMWAVPVMSCDRLLLAVMLPLYLAWASGISALDMKYVRMQFINKWRQLLKDHHR